MAEYIEKELAVRLLVQDYAYAAADLVKNIPAADVAPVVHAKWTEYENEQDKGFHYCSNCKGQAFNYEDSGEVVEVLAPNCHNCGAKMDL